MADTNNLSQFLTDVASAIKNKTGKTDKIPAASFDTEINNIPTGTVVEKVVTEASEVVEEETAVKIESTPIQEPVVIPENGVAEVLADKALLAENIGLTSDKIIKGATILNVEGTAEGGSDDVNTRNKLMYILGINQIAFNKLKSTLGISQDYIDAGGTPNELCYVLNEIIEGGN